MTIKIPIFKSCLLAASLAQLTPSLSADTKLDFDILTMPKGATIEHSNKMFSPNTKDIVVRFDKTNNVLIFPENGTQPTTKLAGLCSGARNLDDKVITRWYVNMFLANFVVNDSETKHSFKKTLEKIAEDPVGRVLLYRLIIETTRVDEKGEYCCEQGIDKPTGENIENRKNCCILGIKIDTGLAFSRHGIIYFDPKDTEGIPVLSMLFSEDKTFDSFDEKITPLDMGLFHEMLHWFHFLRNPERYDNHTKIEADCFKYPLRCYYGDVTDLITWGNDMKAEEIATILGTPNWENASHLNLIPSEAFLPQRTSQEDIETSKGYIPHNESFFNGDDLSENVYRISQSENKNDKFYFRFGHNDEAINKSNINFMPKRIQLAHKVAIECYKEITGKKPSHWDLQENQAIQPEI